MSRVVEFMGLPGSGKSTLAAGLLSDLPALRSCDDALVQCYRQRQTGPVGAAIRLLPPSVWQHRIAAQEATTALHAFSCAYPELVMCMFDLLTRTTLPTDWRSCILFAMFKRFAEHQLISEAPDAILVEEGLTLGLMTVTNSLDVGSPCDAEIAAYVDAMPGLGGAIYVKADIAQCAERLLRRPELPLLWASCSRGELEAQLAYSQSIFDRAVPLLVARGVPVGTVENQDGSLESVSAAVRQFTASCILTKGESERT